MIAAAAPLLSGIGGAGFVATGPVGLLTLGGITAGSLLFKAFQGRKAATPDPERKLPEVSAQPEAPEVLAHQEQAEALMLMLAAALDTYMELKVPNWQEVMRNPARETGHEWFRGTQLKMAEVNTSILAELEKGDVGTRKVHDHLTAALYTISSQWAAKGRLKKGEMKKAFMSLYGLLSAIVKMTMPGNEQAYKRVMASPQTAVAFWDSRYPWPPGISLNRLREILNKHWG